MSIVRRPNNFLLFRTVNLPLAASFLTAIPASKLDHIDSTASLDGTKRLIVLRYSKQYEQAVREFVTRFNAREVSVDLWQYNKNLNALRDAIHRGASRHTGVHADA